MATDRKKKAKAGKKTAARKPSARKPASRKAAAKRTSPKKKPAKAAGKKTAKRALRRGKPPERLLVEPGPPPGGIPPVEEPAPQEMAVGVVTHYYSHLGVAVVQINQGSIKTRDTIRIKGHTTDFSQAVQSMEYEHRHIDEAAAGQAVGMKVVDHAREHDIVYLVRQ